MKYSTQKQEVTKELMKEQEQAGEPLFEYTSFVIEIFNAVEHQNKINVLPYNSSTNPFSDVLIDFDYTPSSSGGLEQITLIFQNHAPFTFDLNRSEVKQPQPAKYYVNNRETKQEVNMRFNV